MKNELFDSIVNLGFSIFNLIVNWIVKILTFYIPKNPRRVLIGLWRGNRFADNARYCYFELKEYDDIEVNLVVNDKKLYKILKEENINVVKKWSLKSVYLHLTSKYHVIDQDHIGLLGYLSVNAVRINLWHGVPIKKIWKLELKDKKNKLSYIIEKLNQKIRLICKGYCSIGRWYVFDLVMPSKFDWDKIFCRCVFSDLIKPIYCKYPRVDYMDGNIDNNVFLEEEKEKFAIIERYKKENKKIVFYAPTFRDKSDTKILGVNSIDEFNKYISLLEKDNIVLMIKMHAVETSKIENLENCIILDGKCDISEFMKYSDCLITDYSSTYFDYLVYDRPIIFYPYDYESYANADRGFLLDYDKHTPGDKAYNIKELYDLIEKLNKNNWKDKYAKDRKELKEKLWDDSFCTIGEYIRKECNKG